MKTKVLFILIAVIFMMGIGLSVSVSASSADPSTYLKFNGNTNGTGAYIEVPDNAKLHLTTNFTIEAWVRWDGTNGYKPFFSKPQVDNGNVRTGFIMGLSDGKPIIALIGINEIRAVWSAPTPLVTGVWTHVAGTYDGKVLRVFVNGKQVAQESYLTSDDVGQGSTSLLIGREFKTGLFDRSFGGALSDVRLWNTVLSENVISSYLNKTDLSGHPNALNLVGNWKLDEGSGNIARDTSGNGLNGFFRNNPIWYSDWTYCSGEGQNCVFTGTKEVRYGENGYYNYQILINGTSCTNNVLGDPLYGVHKNCYIRNVADTTAPTTSDNAPTSWVNTDVTVKLTASDSGSGVAATNYTVDGGVQQTGISVVLTTEGVHTLAYWSVDIAGNIEAKHTATIKIDKTAPATAGNAPTVWVNTDVTVNMSAIDGGSGVASTHYTVDGGLQQTGTSVVLTTEGVHTLSYWSVDIAGNIEAQHTATIKIDKTAPATADNAPTVWVNTNITVNLTAIDGGSGVASTHYTVDGGLQQTGTSVVLTAEGIHTIAYWSVDNVGNIEMQHKATVKIDKTAPVSVSSVNPAAPTGSNGWYTSDVTLSLSVTDNLSGVTETVYQVNNGVRATYTGSIPAFSDGVYKVNYGSTDNAGNVEQIKTVEFKIDKTAPILTVKLDKPVIAPKDDEKMAVINATLTASDATSGVASVILTSITYNKIVNGKGNEDKEEEYPKKAYFIAKLGTSATSFSVRAKEGYIYTITYTVTDNAGNKSTVVSTVSVIKPKEKEDGNKGNNEGNKGDSKKDSSKKGE